MNDISFNQAASKDLKTIWLKYLQREKHLLNMKNFKNWSSLVFCFSSKDTIWNTKWFHLNSEILRKTSSSTTIKQEISEIIMILRWKVLLSKRASSKRFLSHKKRRLSGDSYRCFLTHHIWFRKKSCSYTFGLEVNLERT